MTPPPLSDLPLEVISVGRIQVDLYGEQIGGSLEDMRSFVKLLGGAPANIAVGASRLGLRVGMISRVGDEQMGRFVLRSLEREKVDTRGVVRDAGRLTSLALLGIRDSSTFPLLYYRENCADAALSVDDIDPSYIASAQAVVVTGTLCANPVTEAACHEILRLARLHDTMVVLDIDFRPVLWGLTAIDQGESRFVSSRRVTDALRCLVASCDVIVGTEEEFQIAGGVENLVDALQIVRSASAATLVVKLGAEGCVVFEGEIGRDRAAWNIVAGFPVDVVNVLGAGDAFLAGLLRGRLRGEGWTASCTYANACGAIVVTRNSCAPATPSFDELRLFLDSGRTASRQFAQDADFARLHRHSVTGTTAQTNAVVRLPDGFSLATGLTGEAAIHKIRQLIGVELDLAGIAILSPTDLLGLVPGGTWCGVRLDDAAINRLAGRAYERLNTYPADHHMIVALDQTLLPSAETSPLGEIRNACTATGRDLLVELPCGEGDPTELVSAVYAYGIKPDWWLVPASLEEQTAAALVSSITAADPLCLGMIVDITGVNGPAARERLQKLCASTRLRVVPLAPLSVVG